MINLSSKTLAQVGPGVAVPGYDRTALRPGIVHIGVGNFHRVHQAVAVEDCLHLPDHEGWGICGVGLGDGEAARAKAAAFAGQDGLYTVTTCWPDGRVSARVVGAMIEYLHAPADPEVVLRRLVAPDTRIVSLTVTEGAYNIDEATALFVLDTPDVVHDLSGKPPRTAFGFIVEALSRRRTSGLPPFTVLSCDNLRHNGDTTRLAVTSFARARDAGLADWIEARVTFPNSMVDRIAPRVAAADRERLNTQSGVADAMPAFCEDFTQWVVEDRFCAARPALERAGVTFRDDVGVFEAVKGRLLNASHMLLSYPAILCGFRQVHEALREPLLVELLETFMDRDVIPSVQGPEGVSLQGYKAKIIERFSNPAIGDQLLRIAHDGASKLPVFHSKTIAMLIEAGGDLRREAFLLACFGRYFRGIDDLGASFEVLEPQLSASDRALACGPDPLDLLRITPFRGLGLDGHPPFLRWFSRWTTGLRTDGTVATLQAMLRENA